MPKIIHESRFIAYLHRCSRAKRVLISIIMLTNISLVGYFFCLRPLQNTRKETCLAIAMLEKQNAALRSAIDKHKQRGMQTIYKSSWSFDDAGTVAMLNFFEQHGLMCESLEENQVRKNGNTSHSVSLTGSFQQLFSALLELESIQCNVSVDRFVIKKINQENINIALVMRD